MSSRQRLQFCCFLALWTAAVTTLASSDVPFEQRKKIPPPVTGGYTFKVFVVPKVGEPEVLAEEGVLYISSTPLSDSQIKEASSHKYGDHAVNQMDAEDHLINSCFGIVQKGLSPGASLGNGLMLLWIGGNKTKGFIRVYTWADAWETWVITKADGKIAIQDEGAESGWGWASSRIVAESDPTVDLDTCLAYPEKHAR